MAYSLYDSKLWSWGVAMVIRIDVSREPFVCKPEPSQWIIQWDPVTNQPTVVAEPSHIHTDQGLVPLLQEEIAKLKAGMQRWGAAEWITHENDPRMQVRAMEQAADKIF